MTVGSLRGDAGDGRIVRLGNMPVDLSLQSFYNLVEPDNIGPEWSVRFTWQFRFPRGSI